jgi:dTDP-4-dehydrorhamnose reductase
MALELSAPQDESKVSFRGYTRRHLDPEQAFAKNARCVKSARVFFISTVYFDSTAPRPYDLGDPTAPINLLYVYKVSKTTVEKPPWDDRVLLRGVQAGYLKYGETHCLDFMGLRSIKQEVPGKSRRALQKRLELFFVADQVGSATFTRDRSNSNP